MFHMENRVLRTLDFDAELTLSDSRSEISIENPLTPTPLPAKPGQGARRADQLPNTFELAEDLVRKFSEVIDCTIQRSRV